MSKEQLSIGEQRVRVDFNVSNNSDVDMIKLAAAELIDRIDTLKGRDPRLAALAMTAIEEGAMWAVKLATSEYWQQYKEMSQKDE
jgi:hypothetical protein